MNRGLIEDIELALLANNAGGGIEYKQSFCQCDGSIGNIPCQYCAIHNALEKCKKLLEKVCEEECKEITGEVVSVEYLREHPELAKKLEGSRVLVYSKEKRRYWSNKEDGYSFDVNLAVEYEFSDVFDLVEFVPKNLISLVILEK